MATIPKSGITNGQTIQASQITNIIDALDGTTNNELIINGPITASGDIKGSITNAVSSSHAISSSYAVSSSHAISSSYAISSSHAISSSYALTASHALDGGTPGGFSTQVQFNNNGSFGGDSDFTFNATQNRLTVEKATVQEIKLPANYDIKEDGGDIIFNEAQEDVGTTLNGFGATTSINLGDGDLGILGDTVNINTFNSSQNVNIGTTQGSINTIGGATSGNLNLNTAGNANIAINSNQVNIGASTERIQLVSGQIRNAAPAYFYGNSGTTALNIGVAITSTNSLNSRAYFTVSDKTSQLGLKSTTNGSGYFKITAYETYSAIAVQNPTGNSFFINNDKSLSNIQFGGGGNNGRVVVYTSNNSLPANQKPGAAGGAYGGLYVAKNLELGGAYAWKASGTTWTVSSDERLKENIITASIETCYDSIKNIPLKRFNYTENYSETPLHDINQLGWIAQEVALELPKAISSGSFTTWTTYTGSEATTGSNGSIVEPGDRVQDISLGSQTIENFLSLDSDQIIKIMFGAIQHLQAKVEALENQ